MKTRKSLLLFSGGLESTAIAFMLKPEYALTIDYGQNCFEAEFKASKKICDIIGIQHYKFKSDLKDIGFGNLFSKEKSSLSNVSDWTPFRNQYLITIGCIFASKLNLKKVLIGSVLDDFEYMDGKKEFVELINNLVEFQEGNIEVVAPGISMKSIELIKESGIPKNTLFWTHSCTNNRYSCGLCRSCIKRKNILEKLNYI